jgi:hypothetical protein
VLRTVRSYLLQGTSQVEFAQPWFKSSKIYQFLNCLKRNQYSVFCVATRLWAERSGLRLPTGARDFSFLKNVRVSSGTHPGSYSVGTGFLSPEAERRGREADHFHIVSWLRMSGGIPLHPVHAFMECTRTFPYPFTI